MTVGLLSFAGIVTERLGLLDVLTAWRRVATLEREKRELLDYAQRLCASHKMAQVDVLGQEADSTGRIVTRLRWTEFDDSAVAKPPRELTVFGKQVFFEAFVIKFQHRLIGDGDPEKGFSRAAFRRAFGDQQTPQTGPALSTELPEQLNSSLWKRFWEMVDNPQIAERNDVRIAQCEAPSVPMSAGQRWELTLDAAGGLNIRKLTQMPDVAQAR